jgi:hypothetical protein
MQHSLRSYTSDTLSTDWRWKMFLQEDAFFVVLCSANATADGVIPCEQVAAKPFQEIATHGNVLNTDTLARE